MAILFTIAILAGVALACGLIVAAIAEHRRKSILAEMMDEAERVIRHDDQHPWVER